MGSCLLAQSSLDGGIPLGRVGPVGSLGGDLSPDRLDDPLATMRFDQASVFGLVDQPAYCRQGASTDTTVTYPSHLPNEIRLAGS